ncbi:MAG: glycosyltransferase family 39 protein [Okeania sp. SIO2C9]|uniref:ArnT family glycosyltransferase n=1 Tax=Okeania sp. SIO2C9 TaxID=2607791 RepID=UPI0013C0751D|nr:glycosyltransferase family 39 protein [Okeania sp. SIO2C9]NEQ71604.1 glycosyltransferase family 39 protein [Okeania sp. SIO2C9]
MNTTSMRMRKFVNKDFIISVLIVLLVILMGILLTPFEYKWFYNTDEAIEFSRLFHVLQGFTLYREVWSDHPPGWTWLLYIWTALFGRSLLAAKILALLLAAAGIVAFYWILKLFFDRPTAIFGVLLFSSTVRFLPAITVITIDMPSLALGIVGILLFLYGLKGKGKSSWLMVLSGIIFAYAMTIKFFTALLIVVLFGCSKIIAKHLEPNNPNFKFPWLWLGVILIGFFLLMLTYWPFPYYLLVEFHKNARPLYGSETLFKLFKRASQTDLVLLLVCLSSILLSVIRLRNQIWRVLIPLVLSGLMLLQFSVQRPVWWIYYPLIIFPLVWISCLPFWHFLSQLRNKNLSHTNKSKLLLLILMIVWLFPIGQAFWRYSFETMPTVADLRSSTTVSPKQELFESVQKFSKNNKYILTDDAMYAVYSQIPIPPEVAVLSNKRVRTEKLEDEFFIDIIERYQPEQIVWIRFTGTLKQPEMQEALEKYGYQSINTTDSKFLHYVRTDIVNQS